MTDEQFDKSISKAMDELPQEYIKGLNNVAVVIAQEPTTQQLLELEVHEGQTLFGLYQGIPLTKRNSSYNFVLPDKITIFKNPILQASFNLVDVNKQVKRTLWHEIAHYYGLDHDRIHALEQKN